MVVFVGCNQQNKTAETKAGTEVTQKMITFADFKKIKGVDNVQDVPFQLPTKLDSIQFFVTPDKDAAHLKIAYNKLDNYYTKIESDDNYYNKDVTFTRTEITDLFNAITPEEFDLVIENNERFVNLIVTKEFERAQRILFRTGNYNYDGIEQIDFSNIRYIKGEEPVTVIMRNTVVTNTHQNTKFENIIVKIGAAGADLIIHSEGRLTRMITIDKPEQTVELDKYHEVYQEQI